MPGAEKAPQTLYDKVLQAHVVDEKLDGTLLLYIGMSQRPKYNWLVLAASMTTNLTRQTATLYTK